MRIMTWIKLLWWAWTHREDERVKSMVGDFISLYQEVREIIENE